MNQSAIRNVVRALAALAVLLIIVPFWVFVIDERELAVVLRFGDPVREYVEPGAHFKIPFVETVRRLPKTNQFWGNNRDVLLPDLPTRDDKKLQLIPWAVWRIKEPTVFVQRMRTEAVAEQRVAQITRSAIRDVISQYDLAELVRSTDRELPATFDASISSAAGVEKTEAEKELEEISEEPADTRIKLGRQQILDEIREKAQQRMARQSSDQDAVGRGIELIDIGISQIDFVPAVRTKTFDRWIAEREAISSLNVNEGERLKQAIINETKAEVARLEGEGQQRASEIKGEADATVIQRYAEAIDHVGDFFTFVRTLQAYETAIGKDSQLILTTDSQLLEMLKGLPAQPPTTETAR